MTNRTSPSGNLLNKSGFAGCQRSGSLTALYSLGEGVLAYCFTGLGLSPLVPVKRTLYAPAYQDILDYFILQLCGNSLVIGSLCSKMAAKQVHKNMDN